jgi:hypothetical protein
VAEAVLLEEDDLVARLRESAGSGETHDARADDNDLDVDRAHGRSVAVSRP